MNRKILGIATLLASLLVIGAVPARSQGLPPDFLDQIGIDQRLDGQVPLDLVFRDERGKEVVLGD